MMIPRILKIIRHAYVLFVCYLLINIFVCLGLIANISGVVSKDTPNQYFTNGLNASRNIFTLIVLSTIAYILIEITFRVYPKKNKPESVTPHSVGLNKFFAYFYLIVFSYMGYLFSMCLISNKFFIVFASNLILDVIVIYFLIRLFIQETSNRKQIVKTWIIMVVLCILMIAPYSIFYMPMIKLWML
jgi:hypothetical protein